MSAATARSILSAKDMGHRNTGVATRASIIVLTEAHMVFSILSS